MFIPLRDTDPLKRIRFQYVTVALIVINVAVSRSSRPAGSSARRREHGGLRRHPAKLMAGGPASGSIFATGAFPIPERFTLISYMFIHGSWIHLLGNMLFLWVFRDNTRTLWGISASSCSI